MKRILVTGGAGFIGSHLCEFLLNKGDEVICVDNFFTGQKRNILHLMKNPYFEVIRHDITWPLYLEVDQIYHLASPAAPIHYQKDPIQTTKTNVLGSIQMLGLAKRLKIKILLASTSEIYGDPKEHPQKESYFGNVNTLGPRACYDEAKRCAETLFMDYWRQNNVKIKIVRIFNSILGNEPVVLFNDHNFHLETISKYVNNLNPYVKREIFVPSFNLKNYKISLNRVSAVIKHSYTRDAYEISLRYGRKIKVTGDHSVFKMNSNDLPEAIPVRKLKTNDYVAIPSKLPVIEKDLKNINIFDELIKYYYQNENDLWKYAVCSNFLKKLIIDNRKHIYKILKLYFNTNSKNKNNSICCEYNKYKRNSLLPIFILKKLGFPAPPNAVIRIYAGGAHIYTPNIINIDADLLWLLGFYLAEGCYNYKKYKNCYITFSSDDYLLKKAKTILENKFQVHVVQRKTDKTRCPAIFAHSKILCFIFKNVFQIINHKPQIPRWIFQLPLPKLKYFLEGFKDGDGTHSGKKLNNELCFDTTSKTLATDLSYLLLRFGIIASSGKYYTKFKQKYGDRKFPFYRLTVCKVSDFNILNWDKKIVQSLNAKRLGDLVWAQVKKIKKVKTTQFVYDFSVPNVENFVAGNGVCCHNTYGPKMALNDGRVVSNFIIQALQNKPITVYGKGQQTRSFCYVDDLVKGIYKMMETDDKVTGPINLGNPGEFTILELAKLAIKLTKSKSKIVYEPLPKDDPKQRRPDISLAKKILKWQPTIPLAEGLKKSIPYFKDALKNAMS